MIDAPENWEELWAADGSEMESRLYVGADCYGMADMSADGLALDHYLYASHGVGNACAGRLEATLFDPRPIADGVVECRLQCRMVSADGATATGWVDQGTWWLNSVEYDEAAGTARLSMLDGLALADAELYPGGKAPASMSWPLPAASVVRQACNRCGIGYPEDVSAISGIQCPDVDHITCREALQSIAAIAGGNWTMAKDGRLRFVPLADMTGPQACAKVSVAGLVRTSGSKAVTEVTLSTDADGFQRGSSGYGIAATCHYAGDEAANAAFYAVRGKRYQGWSATGAWMSPLLELGDVVEVEDTGQKVALDSMSVTYEQGMWGSFDAPLRDEVEQRIKYRDADARKASRLAAKVEGAAAGVAAMATEEYVSDLIGRINARANEGGGWTYITEGHGIRTYDAPVSDPLEGAEASSVVEVKGGTIRIANSRYTSGEHEGEWEWLTVFESGHIASQLVTAVNIVAGFIGSPSGNYWNLDTGELVLQSVKDAAGNAVDLVEVSAGLEASAQAAAKVARLSVGGANLLNGTDSLDMVGPATYPRWSLSQWGSYGDGAAKVANLRAGCPNNSLSKEVAFALSGPQEAGITQKLVPVADGEDYVLSCYARGSGRLTLAFGFKDGDNGSESSASVAATEGWRRYYMRVTAGEGNSTYSERAPSTNVRFGASGGPVEVCGMKLERGTVPTDWTPSEEDGRRFAQLAVQQGVNAAKEYANSVSAADREFSKEQRAALDASLTQAEVLKRLTGGKANGIYMEGGALYVNGSYIKSGTVDASLVKTGIVASKSAWDAYRARGSFGDSSSYWNLDTGTMQLSSGNGSETMQLRNGRLAGLRNGSQVGYISPGAASRDLNTGKMEYGLQLQAQGMMRISSPKIAVAATSDTAQTATFGLSTTVEVPFIRRIDNLGNGAIRWYGNTLHMRFINGLLVSVWFT